MQTGHATQREHELGARCIRQLLRRPGRLSCGEGRDVRRAVPRPTLTPSLLTRSLNIARTLQRCDAMPRRSRLCCANPHAGTELTDSDVPNPIVRRSGTNELGVACPPQWLPIVVGFAPAGWLAVVSGFHLPEDKGEVAQIGADVNSLSSHDESTITSGGGGAGDRRRLVAGSNCDGHWCVSSQTSPPPPPPCPRLPCVTLTAFLLAAIMITVVTLGTVMLMCVIVTMIARVAVHAVKSSAPPMLVPSISGKLVDFPRITRATCIAMAAITAMHLVALQMVAFGPIRPIANAASDKISSRPLWPQPGAILP